MLNPRFTVLTILLVVVFLPLTGFSQTSTPSGVVVYAEKKWPPPAGVRIHIVREKETLSQIARLFDTNLSLLVKLNHLDNPDLIFPGDRLIIEIQPDDSVVVKSAIQAAFLPPLSSHKPEKETNIQVTYPDREDILAPEVPVAVAETRDMISIEPRRSSTEFKRVFQSFFEFLHWLGGKNRPAFLDSGLVWDPSPSTPYLFSRSSISSPVFNNGDSLFTSLIVYQPFIPDPTTPPPKFS